MLISLCKAYQSYVNVTSCIACMGRSCCYSWEILFDLSPDIPQMLVDPTAWQHPLCPWSQSPQTLNRWHLSCFVLHTSDRSLCTYLQPCFYILPWRHVHAAWLCLGRPLGADWSLEFRHFTFLLVCIFSWHFPSPTQALQCAVSKTSRCLLTWARTGTNLCTPNSA